MKYPVAIIIASVLVMETVAAKAAEPPWAAPPLADSITIRDAEHGLVSWEQFIEALDDAQIVFIGETHDDENTHRVELAVFEALIERRAGGVALALEMFERDVQPVLDRYLAGQIPEAEFLAKSRPWNNYATAYRPLVELARERNIPVFASNFPRPLIATVAQAQANWRSALSEEERTWVPEKLLPHPEEYWRRVDNAVRGHAGLLRETDRLFSTQSLWDNAMADTCAKVLDQYPDRLLLHINGDFHTTYRQGIVYQLLQRKPGVRVVTVSVRPVIDTKSSRWIGKFPAEFVVFVRSAAKEKEEGYFRVTSAVETKYLLHVPSAPSHRRFPLVIALVRDGLRAEDALEWWKVRIGEEAAVAAIEPLYREQQPDMQPGGRWFWDDSFSDDMARAVHSVEEVWAYLCRHFPIEPDRVVVTGEGTGGTAAVAAAVWAHRASLAAVAVEPAQYGKLRDQALPLPELWGDQTPPKRMVQLFVTEQEANWWRQELESYRGVGIQTDQVTITSEAPDRLDRWEQAVRQALGLPSAQRSLPLRTEYLVIPEGRPRAEHWARMQAERLASQEGVRLVVRHAPPASNESVRSLELDPRAFLDPGALPRCPGPFGGTTVLVVPPGTDPTVAATWNELQQNDPLARQSRFHRLRVAFLDSEPNVEAVLSKLESEQRRNILLVPAVFYADPELLAAIERRVRSYQNRMTFHWLPGLGGSPAALRRSEKVEPLHYQIQVQLDPGRNRIRVDVEIALPAELRARPTSFRLDRSAVIRSANVRLESETTETEQVFRLPQGTNIERLWLQYEATFDYALSEEKSEYTRGFRHTRGWVGPEGVYLSGESLWVPTFSDRLVTFQLHVDQPGGWHSISQGSGTSRDESGQARWQCDTPMKEVYLVGGPLVCEKDTAGSTALAVYLREADPALSRKYLTTGAQYLKMYSQLLGPYPYEKFYVVENFWETGYGMPSFTLLGPQVIRFPFILHSSYPHEILHNWWGNGVFVDYSRGNWCEGLTAYLADHLVQEQRGAGAEYRRNSLQRYRDYVATSKDFPLAAFRERHSAATEAVGYAKAMMVFHMARRLIGDEAFRDALADFYRRYQGRRATVDQLFQCIEERSGRSFQNFLRAWWDSPGAPRLEIRNIQVVSAKPTGYRIRGTLAQTQQERLYPLEVPVLVLSDHGTIRQRVPLEGRETALDINVQSRPLALCVDPHFDLMRTLDPRETPATLSGLFGQDSVLAVLPRQATPDAIRGYRQLIEAWQSDEHRIETAWDDQLSEWPADRSVWLLGWENRWLERWSRGAPNVVWNGDAKSMRLGSEVVPVQDRVLVAVLRHPVRADRVVGWLSVDRPAAFAGVARKLPHYGKYSYLVFEGDEPTNTLKGQWPTDDSPLVVDLRGDRAEKLPEIKEASRPLAELPPAFSGNDLHAHVAWLADPAREGRGIGTAGLDAAADYISRKMAEMGLQPAGDAGTYFQTFSVTGPDGQPVVCKNVIGILPGSNPQWKEQAIILSAHYDHLGRGWPDVRSGNEGKVLPGADDNASGVAVMLEVARVLATQQPSRTLVVIAFSAEEMGRLGSRYYVEHPVRPLKETRAVINLDSVGRLKDGALQVLGTGTAEEWVHIFRGCTYVTGVPSRTIDQDVGGSDQVSFVEQGVPAVQLFTGAHGDYHRPTDTADKVDPADLVKVASFVLEAVEYLLERPEPLTVRISDHPASGASQVPRRVSFGIIPAYDYSGPGVKVESIVKDSPAERSGVRAGDVLVEWNEAKISGLREFAELLRKAEAGETVQVRLVRGKDAVVVRVRLEQRGTNSPNN